jgi:hypothetical protein
METAPTTTSPIATPAAASVMENEKDHEPQSPPQSLCRYVPLISSLFIPSLYLSSSISLSIGDGVGEDADLYLLLSSKNSARACNF